MPHAEPRHPWKDRPLRKAIREEAIQEKKEAAIAKMAGLIGNQSMLEKVLDDVQGGPEMRDAVYAMLRPHLLFTPSYEPGDVKDCPTCGMKRGTVIPHECLDEVHRCPNDNAEL